MPNAVAAAFGSSASEIIPGVKLFLLVYKDLLIFIMSLKKSNEEDTREEISEVIYIRGEWSSDFQSWADKHQLNPSTLLTLEKYGFATLRGVMCLDEEHIYKLLKSSSVEQRLFLKRGIRERIMKAYVKGSLQSYQIQYASQSVSTSELEETQGFLLAGGIFSSGNTTADPLRRVPKQLTLESFLPYLHWQWGRIKRDECGQCSSGGYCCQDNPEVVKKIEDIRKEGLSHVTCITQHPGFSEICCNKWVLQSAYLRYQRKRRDEVLAGKAVYRRYRFTAYRQFFQWCSGNRDHEEEEVPFPECVTSAVRDAFPPEELTLIKYPSLQ